MATSKGLPKIPCPKTTSTPDLLNFITHPELAYLKKGVKMVPISRVQPSSVKRKYGDGAVTVGSVSTSILPK